MANIYAALIIKGVKTLDDVPKMVITDDTSVDHKNSIQKGCADYGNYLCNPDH